MSEPGILVASANIPEFSVSELAAALKRTVEGAFGSVRVRGEISGFKRAASGHVYFALKDADALLDAVMWRGTVGTLRFRPEDGLEVVCTGRITTYPGRSRYQIIVERMEPAGIGALMALLEERRRRLQAEGLFAPERKRPLPFLPLVIGVVTSPTGAVIRDILHRIADRFPRRVLVWPVAVQGEGAAAQIAAAIEGFNTLSPGGPVPRPDVLIVARGGGSIEDLWAFNEEVVVRAAAASVIPLIAAVGHETDTTLIDFAADVRAPTPSAAAEMAVPVRSDLAARVLEAEKRLGTASAARLARERERLVALGRGLPAPARLVEAAAQRLDDAHLELARAQRLRIERTHARLAALHLPRPRALLEAAARRLAASVTLLQRDLRHGLDLRRAALARIGPRLGAAPLRHEIERARPLLGEHGSRLRRALERRLATLGARLEAEAKLLESCSYQRVLERGFVLVQTEGGAVIASHAATHPGLGVTLRFHDGTVAAEITGGTASPRRWRRDVPDQGSLL
ncbi:MAG: exodeoxyribonuclease VII large subunit [Alphaproteobacteria bacterium]|nr:exodeoxyribonuclease VII large subunit [Alphaproteobacteria bacterium]